MGTATSPWRPDSWSAMVVVDSGRAFDFLAWYRPLTLTHTMAQKPTLPDLQEDLLWCLARPGTSTPSHFKRMGIEKIGEVAIDRQKLTKCLGEMRPGISAAVSDISLANQLSVGPYNSKARLGEPGNLASIKPGRPFPTNRWLAPDISGCVAHPHIAAREQCAIPTPLECGKHDLTRPQLNSAAMKAKPPPSAPPAMHQTSPAPARTPSGVAPSYPAPSCEPLLPAAPANRT
jgi:hypothetical protein